MSQPNIHLDPMLALEQEKFREEQLLIEQDPFMLEEQRYWKR